MKHLPELKTRYSLERSIETYTDKDKKEFIKLYGLILKIRNILTALDQFTENALLTPRELQDYQSMYLEMYFEFRKPSKVEKENINDDLVFEIELIKQVEVNIDYIVELIKKFAASKGADREILVNIEKAIDSSMELRSKKDLIFDFVSMLNAYDNGDRIYTDFETFMNNKRKEELDNLIEEENLKEKETYEFVKKAFKSGQVETSGEEITRLFNTGTKLSRFTQETAEKSYTQKKSLLGKIITFFERFFNISRSCLSFSLVKMVGCLFLMWWNWNLKKIG
jgi:type I restriction enzyme R subunit